MLHRFLLLTLLLSSPAIEATVITTAGVNGNSCTENQTTYGDTSSSASVACSGLTASASADVVPEPSTLVLFVSGILLVGLKGRMRNKAILLTLLLSPLGLQATVITSASIYDGQSCATFQTTEGALTSSVSVACGGATASASADLFHLSITGYRAYFEPPVSAQASFSHDVAVLGTDQPGFLYVRMTFDHSFNFSSPSRHQYVALQFQGEYLCGANSEGCSLYRFIPYTPGVPVRLFAEISGSGSSWGLPPRNGSFSGTLDFEIVRPAITNDQMTAAPVPGAYVVLVPEPSSLALLTIALASFGLSRIGRTLYRR